MRTPQIEFYDLTKDVTDVRIEELLAARGASFLSSSDFKELAKLPDAELPTRGSEGAAGLDLYASEDKVVPSFGTVMISTGIAINKMPDGCYARVAPRSGLASRGVFVNGGVIDGDYRGEIKVIIFNSLDVPMQFKKGDRIAQLILEKIVYAEPTWVHYLDDDTERGSDGFGSTGA